MLAKTTAWVQKTARYILDLPRMLVLIALLYVCAYLALPATPGNSPFDHPLGWWGWFDQGQYLKAANALLHYDLTPEKHFYPPLYPALGAIFLKWSSGHPYFFVNLFCLLWFAYVFIRVADRYVLRWEGVLLLFGTTILNLTLFENYVIPWTTTLGVALLATGILGLVWLQDVIDKKSLQISGWQVFFVAVCLGLLVPTRPVDAAVGGIFGLALLVGYVRARRYAAASVPTPVRFLTLAVIGIAIGPALFMVFNSVVFGTALGGYIQVAGGKGFFWADLPEKFVSLWLDGEALYGEKNAGLAEHYPWLFLSLAGLVWVLLKGDALLRVISLAIVLLFVLYMPYGDLLPNGLWRYLNIHYFKWTFPFLALFAWLIVKQVLVAWRRRDSWVSPALMLVAVPALLLSLHLAIDIKPLQMSSEPGKPMRFDLPASEVDFIDIKGLNGGFTEVYFGDHRLLLDGHEMQRVRDYRLLPKGSEVRLLFIRPVTGRIIEFMPDPRLVRHDLQLVAQAGSYRFALGPPKPFRENGVPVLISGYRLGDVVDFSRKGDGWLYAAEGWSDPEDWGRWSLNKESRIIMYSRGYTGKELKLELTFGVLVHQKQPCQRVRITGNGRDIASQEICLEGDGGVPMLRRYILPVGTVSKDGLLELRIATPDATSPKRLGISDDARKLGVGLKTLRLYE